MKYAISACLLGVNCKYSGGNNRNEELLTFLKDKDYLAVCPEVRGGLTTPRACCEIVNDRVMNTLQEDVTQAFYQGAVLELNTILEAGITCVILQPRSPSCGVGHIYDGTFQGTLLDGDGIFAAMCKKRGLEVWNCTEFLEKQNRNLK